MSFKWQEYVGWQWVALVTLLCVAFAHRVSAATAPLEVTASLPIVGEWVQSVGGERVRVQVISPPGADPHSFEPSVRSIQAVNRSQALFIIGLGLEAWAGRLLEVDPALKIVSLAPATSHLRRIDSGNTHHDDSGNTRHINSGNTRHINSGDTHHDDSGNTRHINSGDTHRINSGNTRHDDYLLCEHKGAHNESGSTSHSAPRSTAPQAIATHPTAAPTHTCAHGEFDPHVWLDPLRVKQIVRSIEQTLTALAPQDASYFSANADAYCAQLDALDSEIVAILAPIEPQRRKLVTNHDNLHYFADRYDFVVLGTLFGVQGSANGQPSARRVREIVSQIQQNDVQAVFADAFSTRSLLQAVVMEAGISASGTLYSVPAGASGPTANYLQMMRYNANEIARVLASSSNAQ